MSDPAATPGLRRHRGQVAQLVAQVFLVGLALGLTRTVVPGLAESEFGVARGSFVALSGFVVAFGVVKAALNLVAGGWSEGAGRRPVLIAGWIAALPVPVLIWAAPDWSWIVAATVLLGVNQGLCWSMTQTAKLDLTLPGERGLVMGLNEFAGYGGVAAAGFLTGLLAESMPPRLVLLAFGLAVALAGLALARVAVRETLPARRVAQHGDGTVTTAEAFARMTWRDRHLVALSQAGLVEKFVDALVWVILPGWLIGRGLTLGQAGAVAGIYGLVWGVAQIGTGRLSDRIGRLWPNVGGMALCTAGVLAFPLVSGLAAWSAAAAVTGLGMALLYPNLSAAVADAVPASWRGTAIGIYRFWRDLGYAVGALGLGIAAQAGGAEAAFAFVGVAMAASTALLWLWARPIPPAPSPGPSR